MVFQNTCCVPQRTTNISIVFVSYFYFYFYFLKAKLSHDVQFYLTAKGNKQIVHSFCIISFNHSISSSFVLCFSCVRLCRIINNTWRHQIVKNFNIMGFNHSIFHFNCSFFLWSAFAIFLITQIILKFYIIGFNQTIFKFNCPLFFSGLSMPFFTVFLDFCFVCFSCLIVFFRF